MQKVALLTGGSGELGSLLIKYLSEKQIKLIVLDKSPISNPDIKVLVEKRIIDYNTLDLSDFNQLKTSLDSILKKYDKIDIVINNAAQRAFDIFNNFTLEEIIHTINVNLVAPLIITKVVIDSMIKQKYGKVINISSRLGFFPHRYGTLYNSTKAALTHFSLSLFHDLRVDYPNITINVICPDSFRTREGQKLKYYDYITQSILKKIDNIIETKINGKIFYISKPSIKLIDYLKISKNLIRHIYN